MNANKEIYLNQILQNLDKGFDPEDPAVKGIEDWECSNNLDAMDPSLDNLVRELKFF